MIPEFYGHVRKLSESEVLGHEHGLEHGLGHELEHGLGHELSMSHPWKPIWFLIQYKLFSIQTVSYCISEESDPSRKPSIMHIILMYFILICIYCSQKKGWVSLLIPMSILFIQWLPFL